MAGAIRLPVRLQLSASLPQPGADVDYLFAQVKVSERAVDTSPNCGNMLAGVGPFAIETGLIPARNGTTPVRIYNVNTRKLIEARIATPNGQVVYDGEARIDGVPGTAAPVHLAFLGAAGSKTGKLLPTGSAVEQIEGIVVSCVDAAMPVVIARAEEFGKSGHESAAALSADSAFMARLEKVRIQAGIRMGFPDAADRVIPKANHHCRTSPRLHRRGPLFHATSMPWRIRHHWIGRIGNRPGHPSYCGRRSRRQPRSPDRCFNRTPFRHDGRSSGVAPRLSRTRGLCRPNDAPHI